MENTYPSRCRKMINLFLIFVMWFYKNIKSIINTFASSKESLYWHLPYMGKKCFFKKEKLYKSSSFLMLIGWSRHCQITTISRFIMQFLYRPNFSNVQWCKISSFFFFLHILCASHFSQCAKQSNIIFKLI